MAIKWADSTRSQCSAALVAAGAESLNLLSLARGMTEGREEANLRFLLSYYVRGACTFHDHLHYEFRDIINQVGIRSGLLVPGESLFDEAHSVKTAVLASLCPELISAVYRPRSNAALEAIPLLEPCPNELADNSLPPPMNMLLYRSHRPPMHAYATHDAVVYAHPFRYQILSRDRTSLWISGSPRALSRVAIGNPEIITITGDVVVLRDRFNFNNFSHFLLDGVTRALLLEQRLGSLRSSVLVFGGVPSDYQEVVCQSLIRLLSLEEANIFFPSLGVILEPTQRCIWFSDQVESYTHPAQMAHPTSVKLLRSVAEIIPAEPSNSRRIYVSRADAEQRRVCNEHEISAMLATRGFETVQLSQLSISQQVGLFRGAEVIIAPHGMGMTHVAMADHLQGIVELFSPKMGTDAYAFIAKAGNIKYSYLVGASVGSPVADFEINCDQISWCVDTISRHDARLSWRKPANLLAGSRSFSSFRAEEGCIAGDVAVPDLIWGSTVFGHATDGEANRVNPVVGRWGAIAVIPRVRYTASCWVWIPEAFSGTEVALGLGYCMDLQVVAADLGRRQQWQRIWTTGVPSSGHCDVELRLSSLSSTSLCSTCWQLERGDEPTSYVETA